MLNLEKYVSIDFTYLPSARKPNIISDADEFREICDFCSSFNNQYRLNKHGCLLYGMRINDGWYEGPRSKTKIEIGLIYDSRIYTFVFWPNRDEGDSLMGWQALKRFDTRCGLIAAPYALRDNSEIQKIKNTIKPAWIKLTTIGSMNKDQEWVNVFHIDINSAYPAFLCKAYPQFYKYFHDLYIHRKDNEENKAYLNFCIGAMQSINLYGNRYPELAKAGINGTIEYLQELTQKLEEQGFIVLGYNTDGIFVYHPEGKIYHDENEGIDMGQWKIDHIFDKIRFKSAGAYEYIENGEYHAVVRGVPKKISKNFVWGDIYKHHPKVYTLENGKLIEHIINDEEM